MFNYSTEVFCYIFALHVTYRRETLAGKALLGDYNKTYLAYLHLYLTLDYFYRSV